MHQGPLIMVMYSVGTSDAFILHFLSFALQWRPVEAMAAWNECFLYSGWGRSRDHSVKDYFKNVFISLYCIFFNMANFPLQSSIEKVSHISTVLFYASEKCIIKQVNGNIPTSFCSSLFKRKVCCLPTEYILKILSIIWKWLHKNAIKHFSPGCIFTFNAETTQKQNQQSYWQWRASSSDHYSWTGTAEECERRGWTVDWVTFLLKNKVSEFH